MRIQRFLQALAVPVLLLFSITVSASTPVATGAPAEWARAAQASYKLLWKTITDAALYVDPAQPAPASGDIQDPDYSKRLRIEYGVGVSRDRFVQMARDALTEHWPAPVLAANQKEIDQFYGWMQDVKKGDAYTVSWHAAEGFALALNDTPVGAWQNPEAAQIILSIWLGQASVAESQRDALLQQWRASLAGKPG